VIAKKGTRRDIGRPFAIRRAKYIGALNESIRWSTISPFFFNIVLFTHFKIPGIKDNTMKERLCMNKF
jgi:hypothetical protein